MIGLTVHKQMNGDAGDLQRDSQWRTPRSCAGIWDNM